jgi:hypothetical protein
MGSEMAELGIYEQSDDALIVSVDKFAFYEALFQSPDHFVAYLDFRLSVQRRPWLTVVDEYEMLGWFLSHREGQWMVHDGSMKVFLTPRFTDDFTELVGGLVTSESRLPEWLRHRNVIYGADFLSRLRKRRPRGWLRAASAVWRTPRQIQETFERVIPQLREKLLSSDAASYTTADQQAAVALVPEGRWRKRSVRRQIEMATAGCAMVWIAQSRGGTEELIGVRALDDQDCWWWFESA